MLSPARLDRRPQARSLFDPEILLPAILESFVKLDPRWQVRNPVMFIVEVGSVFVSTATQHGGQETTITSFHTRSGGAATRKTSS